VAGACGTRFAQSARPKSQVPAASAQYVIMGARARDPQLRTEPGSFGAGWISRLYKGQTEAMDNHAIRDLALYSIILQSHYRTPQSLSIGLLDARLCL
jgi:hypothetical protein